jgi:hypothetical protein
MTQLVCFRSRGKKKPMDSFTLGKQLPKFCTKKKCTVTRIGTFCVRMFRGCTVRQFCHRPTDGLRREEAEDFIKIADTANIIFIIALSNPILVSIIYYKIWE